MLNERGTLILMIFGLSVGITGELIDSFDLILGYVLKGLSIVSLIVAIIANWSKFIKQLKAWFK